MGCGGLIRDYNGNMIMAFAYPLTHCSVVFAEFAVYDGLSICNALKINRIWVEVDAKIIIQIIENKNSCNVEVLYLLRSILMLLANMNTKISHIFCEGNKAADWLVRKGSILNSPEEYIDGFIPKELNAIIRMDKWGIPYIKC